MEASAKKLRRLIKKGKEELSGASINRVELRQQQRLKDGATLKSLFIKQVHPAGLEPATRPHSEDICMDLETVENLSLHIVFNPKTTPIVFYLKMTFSYKSRVFNAIEQMEDR